LDGKTVDLPTDARVTHLGDRIAVRTGDGTFSGVAVQTGDAILVSFRGHVWKFDRTPPLASPEVMAGSGAVTAPMPGMIVEVLATVGAELKRGAKLLVIEAMKTQLPLMMPFDGVVESLHVSVGQQVEQDALVATIKPVETAGVTISSQ
jgi:3-methylcrotonyl-CoA carboxylase alpha subunit